MASAHAIAATPGFFREKILLGMNTREYVRSCVTPFNAIDMEGSHGYPPVYNILPTQPGPGWNAVSLSEWKIRRLELMNTYPDAVLWPDRFKPAERVGKSTLLYYFPER